MMEHSRGGNLRNSFSIVSNRASIVLFYYFILVATGGSIITGVDGHLAAFVNTDGKPNINTRPIRGPTVPPVVPEMLYDYYQQPSTFGFTRNMESGGGGGLGQQENSKHHNNLHHRLGISQRTNANVNKGESSEINDGNGSSDDYFLVGNEEDLVNKATFTPYISARVLSNIPEFFQHLRENLEALHRQEMGDPEYESRSGLELHENEKDILRHHSRREEPLHGLALRDSPDDVRLLYPGSKHRWLPPASGRRHSESHHSHNTRSFVEAPTLEENFMRRATSNYNPAWSYTKLGLGKRGR